MIMILSIVTKTTRIINKHQMIKYHERKNKNKSIFKKKKKIVKFKLFKKKKHKLYKVIKKVKLNSPNQF
jgi:hypothetical protein